VASRLARALSLAALVLLPAFACAASKPDDDASMLLLEVRLKRHVLADSVTAWQYPDDIRLPLGELARLLTLAIKTAPGDGRASGYVLSEQRSFSLDATRGEVHIDGRSEQVDPAQLRIEADDIYVPSRLLARWLPIDLRLDMSSLAVEVIPREQLPLEAGLDRRERGARAGGPAAYQDPGYPRLASPYALASMPFIDQTIAVDVAHGPSGRRGDAAYTAYLTADLLGMQAALFASRSLRDETGGTLRLTVGRRDPDGGLLGALGARTALAGSVVVPGLDNVSRTSAIGNGAAISNRPLNQPTRFDRHTLQGDLPPGWDVELYYNEALVGYQQARADGKYSFDDLPLAYGTNDFRLAFHGPLGQLRVERRSFLLEQSAVAPGALYYDIAAHRDNDGVRRALARFDWGVASFLSASGAVTRIGERQYLQAGLHSYWRSFILSADAARADDGGRLGQLTLKTRLAGMALSASRAMLDGFASEIFPDGANRVHARDELRADGALLPMLPVSLLARRESLVSGVQNIDAQARVSLIRNGMALTNSLRWQSLAGARYADGAIRLSRRVPGMGISGQVDFTALPRRALSAIALAIDRNLAEGYLANLGVTRSFQDRQVRISGGINKSLGSYGLGVTAFWSSRHEIGVGARLFVALGREPRQSRWLAGAQPMAGSGTASVRVFLDKNQNGVMDDGDEAIKGAGFTVNGGNHLARTDAAGFAWLDRLPPNVNVDIGFDPGTLDDPQWIARVKGVRLVPRPGKVAAIDFAVSVSGDVDGTTWLMANGAKRGIGDLEVELVDAAGAVALAVKSNSDGTYVIPYVLPGRYQLRIAPAQLKRLRLADSGSQAVTITRDGNSLNGRDFVVTAAPP
jgi:hypothetical protein